VLHTLPYDGKEGGRCPGRPGHRDAARLKWLPGLRTLLDYRAAWLARHLAAGLLTALLTPAEMGWRSGASGCGRCSGRRRRRRCP
jgi:hypothetical protein